MWQVGETLFHYNYSSVTDSRQVKQPFFILLSLNTEVGILNALVLPVAPKNETWTLLTYRESTHAILIVTCINNLFIYLFILNVASLYDKFVYSVLEQHIINTTGMYTITTYFIPYIDGPLGEWILSPTSNLRCSFTSVKLYPLVILLSLIFLKNKIESIFSETTLS